MRSLNVIPQVVFGRVLFEASHVGTSELLPFVDYLVVVGPCTVRCKSLSAAFFAYVRPCKRMLRIVVPSVLFFGREGFAAMARVRPVALVHYLNMPL